MNPRLEDQEPPMPMAVPPKADESDVLIIVMARNGWQGYLRIAQWSVPAAGAPVMMGSDVTNVPLARTRLGKLVKFLRGDEVAAGSADLAATECRTTLSEEASA